MSSFYLWLDSAKTGPHSLASIWHALDGGEVRPETLCCEVGGPDQWTPIKDCPAFTPGRALRAKAPEPITPAQFLQDSAQPVQAAPAATPGLNSTVAQALDHAARSQAALAEAIRSVGSGFVIAAKLALGLAGLVLVISFLASVAPQTPPASPSRPPAASSSAAPASPPPPGSTSSARSSSSAPRWSRGQRAERRGLNHGFHGFHG